MNHEINIGDRFGRLVVLSKIWVNPVGRKRYSKFVCKCDCGVISTPKGFNLATGLSTSCGCYCREVTLALATSHGHASGVRKTSEYRSWLNMKKRCLNESCNNYANYGGRGITVCTQWVDSFKTFLADMGMKPSPAHSIDRIDVNLGYGPDNCRWSTTKEQSRNTRASRILEFNGHRMTVAEWGEVTGISASLIGARINRLGWTTERALTQMAKSGPWMPREWREERV